LIEVDFVIQGPYAENIYFLIDRDNNRAIVVDPGGEGDDVDEYLEENDLTLDSIICTHGHFDHVEALDYLKKKYKVPIMMHHEDSLMFELEYDRQLKDGDVIEFGGEKIVILHTPGHTYGSICLLGEGFMLSGDTLFAGTIGRTDLGGNHELMMNTLATKFEDIPSNTVIFPGHGPSSTLGTEKKRNHFFKLAKEPPKTDEDIERERREHLQKFMAHEPDDDDILKMDVNG
jgi:hydroxyacylglutathione hydrolase